MRGLLQKLYNRGDHLFSGAIEIRRNVTINRIVLQFFFLSILVLAIFIIIHFILMDRNPVLYRNYLMYLGPLPLTNAVLTLGAYAVRHRTGYPELTVGIVTILGVGVIGMMAVLIGPAIGMHYYMLVFVPIGFYFFRFEQKRVLAYMAIASIVLLVPFNILANTVVPTFPLPDDIAQVCFDLVIGFIGITFIGLTYTFWYESGYSEQKALKLNDELHDLNQQLTTKDENYQRELELAAELQRSFLPAKTLKLDSLDVAYSYLPLGKVSGDQLYFHEEDGLTNLLLWDASGHGVPAALTSMIARECFDKYVKQNLAPAEIFSRVNVELSRKIETQDYLTAFLCQVQKNKLSYASASHSAGFYWHKATNEVQRLDPTGLLIGGLEDLPEPYSDLQLNSEPGDRLLIYTDGLIEQKGTEGEQWGDIMLEQWLSQNGQLHKELQSFHYALMADWRNFVGKTKITDDVTVLSIEFLAS